MTTTTKITMSPLAADRSPRRGKLCQRDFGSPFASVIPVSQANGNDLGALFGYELRGANWVFVSDSAQVVDEKINQVMDSISAYPGM